MQSHRRRSNTLTKGHRVAMTFIYTRCPMPEFCPMMDRHFASLQKAIKESPELKDVRLLSVTIDPKYDKPPVLKAHGLYFSQAIIWVKEHPVLTRKDFMGNHEWCFYSWKEGAAHVFLGPPNVADVWSVKKVNPSGIIPKGAPASYLEDQKDETRRIA